MLDHARLPLATSALATCVTRPGSNPNFRCGTLSGAEAPNVFVLMLRPDLPRRGLFYSNARRHVGWQHTIPGRHQDHARADTFGELVGIDAEA